MATKKVTTEAANATTKKAAPKKVAAKKSPAAKVKPVITNEDIKAKAEEIYLARMASGEPGNEESDWLNAEKALKTAK